MASSATSRYGSLATATQCPYFGGDISDWWALRPIEQAEVILAAYQERLLPELGRLEKLLTHLAIEFGLEYGRLEEVAVFFLDVAREIRDHVQALEMRLTLPPANGARDEDDSVHGADDVAVGTEELSELIVRLQDILGRCAADGEHLPGYARLIDGLRKCQLEVSELLILEAELSR